MRRVFTSLVVVNVYLSSQYLLVPSLAVETPAPANKEEKKEEPKGKKDFDEGKDCYKGQQYQKAAQLFWKAVINGYGDAKVWVYCAQSHALSGNYSEARLKFDGVTKAFPNTKQAEYAKKRLKEIKGKENKLIPDPAEKKKSVKVPPIDPNSPLAQGIKLFSKKDYDGAKTHIYSHLKKHPKDPNAHYYMALVHHYKGKTNKAMLSYRKVAEISPDSNLGKRAIAVLVKIDPQFKNKSRASKKEEKFDIGLVTKITIVKPNRWIGRPFPVRPSTIKTVKNVCRGLPKHINQKLYDGGVTISIAKNYKDEAFHETLNDKHPIKPHVYLVQAPGRTVDKKISIYECSLYMIDGELKPPRSTAQIRHATLHELANALNNIDGDYIKNDTNLQGIFKKEISKLPGNAKRVLKEYLTPPEAGLPEICAEIVSGLLGCKDRKTRMAMRAFPKTTQWLKIRFNL